ncbi:MAG: ATP-binding protein [Bacteroidales bacterium]|nr:ATP-binding protein [Bacteroidales bacterium]
MNSNKLYNPFPVVTYQGPGYFCDRQVETSQLISNIKNGNSTTLISIRRIGKTGLIQHVFTKLPKEIKSLYVDILETENLSHFLNKLTSSLMQMVPEKSSLGKQIWAFIKSIRPVISFDSLTGMPQATFDLKQKDTEKSVDSILSFLDHQNKKTVIAIDEFQQVTKYPETNTDAWLRTRMQQLKNVVFIFSGSQQHLMTELFTAPQRPFFRSTSVLKLEKLNFDKYREFIISQFKKYGKEISSSIVEEMLIWGDVHTYYIQQMCNRVFAATVKQVTPEIWKEQAFELLKEQEIIFIGYRNLLTAHQWKLLKAIAREGKVYMPTGTEFSHKYSLTNPASTLRSLQSLQKYELLYKDFDATGKSYFSVYDVFFQRWCNEK